MPKSVSHGGKAASNRKEVNTKTSHSRALIAYVLGAIFFFYAFVQRVSPSVMTTELMRDFTVGGTALGMLSAMYFYTYAALQLPVGVLVDRFGPRKLMSAAALLCALATLGFAMSDSLLMASLNRALIGGSVAFAFVGTLTITATFFQPARFAMLTGIVLAVGMAGAIFGQAPLRLLVESAGWRQTFIMMAISAVILGFLLYLLVPGRPDKNAAQSTISTSVFHGLKSVIFNLQSWLNAGIGFGMSATMLSFAGLWAVPWLTTTRDLSSAQAGAITSMMFTGWLIGSPVVGWLSDFLGRRKPVLVYGSIVCLLTLIIIVYGGVQSTVTLSVLFLVNGLGACSVVVTFGLVKEWNAPSNHATAMGMNNMCIVGSGAVLQPMIGWFLDVRWQGNTEAGARSYSVATYEFAFTLLIASVLMALVCAIFVKESYCQAQRLE